MRIELSSDLPPNRCGPAALCVLASVDAAKSTHAAQSLRPPLAQYNVSIHRIVSFFSSTLDQLDLILRDRPERNAPSNDLLGPLLIAHERLLYAMAEHMEDCRTILLCFLPVGELAKTNSAVKDFDNRNKDYRVSVTTIVNRIKHNQRRLRPIVFANAEISCPGFFVEGADEAGVIGPDKVIHDRTSEGISFARDLRRHFAHVYIVSARLADAVETLTPPAAPRMELSSTNYESLLAVGRRISILPLIFFPDELSLPEPLAQMEITPSGAERIVIEYPASKRSGRTIAPAQVTTTYAGDGVSRQFRAPYTQSTGKKRR